jgi:hypothetical protein
MRTDRTCAPRRRFGSLLALLGLTVMAAATAGTASESEAGAGEREIIRGMVVSCPGYGEVWGSERMEDSLRTLERAGVEWIAIHPYAAVRRDGTVRWRPAAGEEYLGRAVELVRARGQRLFWKPHLAYWGSFDWRGSIEFGDDEAAWRRFFDGYRGFILDQAAFAERAGAEIFAIGVELERTVVREREWRRLFDEVRQRYSGRITYTANWDRLAEVPFWDRVDLIGVQGYFPLASVDDPDRATLWRGWDGPLRQLEELSRANGDRPILFGEIGYNRSPDAARRPWSPVMEDRESSRALRRRLMEVAVERLEAEPWIAGLFWWKWIPGPAPWDRDFSMKDPEALAVLHSHWVGEGKAATGR